MSEITTHDRGVDHILTIQLPSAGQNPADQEEIQGLIKKAARYQSILYQTLQKRQMDEAQNDLSHYWELIDLVPTKRFHGPEKWMAFYIRDRLIYQLLRSDEWRRREPQWVAMNRQAVLPLPLTQVTCWGIDLIPDPPTMPDPPPTTNNSLTMAHYYGRIRGRDKGHIRIDGHLFLTLFGGEPFPVRTKQWPIALHKHRDDFPSTRPDQWVGADYQTLIETHYWYYARCVEGLQGWIDYAMEQTLPYWGEDWWDHVTQGPPTTRQSTLQHPEVVWYLGVMAYIDAALHTNHDDTSHGQTIRLTTELTPRDWGDIVLQVGMDLVRQGSHQALKKLTAARQHGWLRDLWLMYQSAVSTEEAVPGTCTEKEVTHEH